MHLPNVVTIYMYGSLENEIYMKDLKNLRYLNHIIQTLDNYIQSNYMD